jgi:lambda family phage tail tape measure protein
MAKQIEDIILRLKQEGFENLDKIKGSFRELNKVTGFTETDISKLRGRLNDFAKEAGNTEAANKGLIEAFKGLRSQVDVNGKSYGELTSEITRMESVLRGSTAAIDKQRAVLLEHARTGTQNAKSLQQQIDALERLQRQTRPGSAAFLQLGKDIDQATKNLGRFKSEASAAAATLTQIPAASLEKIAAQIGRLQGQMQKLNISSDEFLRYQQRIALIGTVRSITESRQQVRARNAMYESPQYAQYAEGRAANLELPDTLAGIRLRVSEINAELENITGYERRRALTVELKDLNRQLKNAIVDVVTQEDLALQRLRARVNAQREVNQASGFRAFSQQVGGGEFDPAITKSVRRGRQRLEEENERLRKAANEAFNLSNTPLLLPAAGQTSAAGTGAAISGGARRLVPGRTETTLGAPGERGAAQQGPLPSVAVGVPPAVAGRLAEQFDNLGKSADRARRPLRDIYVDIDKTTRASNGSVNSLEAQIGAWTELRNAVGRTAPAFDTASKKLEQLTAQRERITGGRRLSGMQLAQGVGAALSGGIFGGPEGLIGGLGGLALGGVGGAFAGAAAGAQVAGLRQAGAAAAAYAAEVRRLQLALQGIVTSFDDYKAALAAVASTSSTFNVPIREATQQFTKLSAAVVGSGGSIKDAENTFKGLTASVLATGGSVEDINGALVAAAQVFSKGKVTAEELRGQIGERLAGAFALFAESTGRSSKGLDAALKSGEVTIADFVKFTEFSLAKYGRTAQIIAASPEQAGARLDNALKALQQSVGDSLGPAGAAFQDFATRSIRGLDKLIEKLIELKAVQPGAGYYQQQVLEGSLSIPQLEDRLLRAGQRETALRQGAASAGLGFIADLLPDISAATKEARILEEALIKVRLIEKETNKERKQRQTEEDTADREKLGASYLQAIEQREEALLQARLQREEQIADLRKQSLEQARQLERQFADERRALEREIAQSKRGTADIEEDIARQQRLLAGEDPRLIEAEQRIADVYREARERDIKIKEDYTDREFNRARTIADFQKNTADQINKANEAYAKTLGNIHRTYARDVGKILDEASGKTARRLAAAGKLITAISDLQALQAQRVQVGASPVPSAADMPPVYKQKLDDIERFNKQLLQSRRQQQVTADSFFTAYADQPQFEDIAGLQPLPITRMQRQAARPLRRMWERTAAGDTRNVNSTFNTSVLGRIQRMQQIIDNWDPVGSQWKEIQNNLRETKRSRVAGSVPAAVLTQVAQRMWSEMRANVQRAGGLSTFRGQSLGSQQDFSEYLTDKQLRILQQGLRATLEPAYTSQFGPNKNPGALDRALGTLRPAIVDFRKAIFSLLEQEAVQGRVYAEKALQKLGVSGIKAQYRKDNDPNTIQQRFNQLFKQPDIVPGVGKDFEGAMLPGGFGTSKLARNLGNVASGQLQGVLAGLTNTLIAGTPYRVGDVVGPNTRRLPVQPATQGAPESSAAAKDAALSQGAKQLQLDLLKIRVDSVKPLEEQTRRLQEQNDLFKAQQTYLQQGITPALAEQFAQVDQLGALQRQIAETEKTAAVNRARTAGASEQQIQTLIQGHSELTAQIDSNVQRVKDLAVAYEDAQKAARFTQDERIGLGLREGAEAYVQSIGTMREATAQLAQTGIKGVEDAIFSLVTTGTANFQEFAASILRDTARMIIQQMVLRSIMQIIGAVAPGGSPASALVPGMPFNPASIPGMAFGYGGVFAKNNVVPFAMGGIVDKPTLFPFANGGAGRLGLMGEAGPEAIMPLRRLPSGRLGVEAGGGGSGTTNVTVNVDASGSKAQGDSAKSEQLGRAVSQAVQDELLRQKRPGGLLA